MNLYKIVLLFVVFAAVLLLLSRCTAVKSWFDDVHLVHRFNTPVSGAKTPNGFVVTPSEVRELVPLTKYGWNIYADKEYYYLSKGIQRLFTKTGDNSFLARKNGIKIAGTNRKDYELVKRFMNEQERDRILPGELMKILKEN